MIRFWKLLALGLAFSGSFVLSSFIQICKERNYRKLAYVFESGENYDLDEKDKNGNTALLYLVSDCSKLYSSELFNTLKIIELLREESVKRKIRIEVDKSIEIAVSEGISEIVAAILKFDGLNFSDGKILMTALTLTQQAVKKRRESFVQIVKLLMAHAHIEVNASHLKKISAIHELEDISGGKDHFLQFLLCISRAGSNLMQKSVHINNDPDDFELLSLVKSILDDFLSSDFVQYNTDIPHEFKCLGLFAKVLVTSSNESLVRSIFRKAFDIRNDQALYWLLSNRLESEMASILIDVLEKAASSGILPNTKFEIAAESLSKLPQTTINLRTSNNSTIAHLSGAFKSLSILQKLANNPFVDWGVKNNSEQTAFHVYCTQKSILSENLFFDLLDKYVKAGASSINNQISTGITIVHRSIYMLLDSKLSKIPDSLKTLLLNPEFDGKAYNIAFDVVDSKHFLEILDILFQRTDFDINNQHSLTKSTILHTALFKKQPPENIYKLLDHPSISESFKIQDAITKRTVLHVAIKNYHSSKIIDAMLKFSDSIDITTKDIEGNTPIHIALQESHPSATKLFETFYSFDLLHIKNRYDHSILFSVFDNMHMDIIELLILGKYGDRVDIISTIKGEDTNMATTYFESSLRAFLNERVVNLAEKIIEKFCSHVKDRREVMPFSIAVQNFIVFYKDDETYDKRAVFANLCRENKASEALALFREALQKQDNPEFLLDIPDYQLSISRFQNYAFELFNLNQKFELSSFINIAKKINLMASTDANGIEQLLIFLSKFSRPEYKSLCMFLFRFADNLHNDLIDVDFLKPFIITKFGDHVKNLVGYQSLVKNLDIVDDPLTFFNSAKRFSLMFGDDFSLGQHFPVMDDAILKEDEKNHIKRYDRINWLKIEGSQTYLGARGFFELFRLATLDKAKFQNFENIGAEGLDIVKILNAELQWVIAVDYILSNQKSFDLIDNLVTIATQILVPGQQILFPYGYANHDGSGHTMLCEFKCLASDNLRFAVFNTGSGINNHMSSAIGGRIRYLPYQIFDEVPKESLLESGFFKLFALIASPFKRMSKFKVGANFIYQDLLFPFEDYLVKDLKKVQNITGRTVLDFITDQKSGTCSYLVFRARARYIFGEAFQKIMTFINTYVQILIIKSNLENGKNSFYWKQILLARSKSAARALLKLIRTDNNRFFYNVSNIDDLQKYVAQKQKSRKMNKFDLELYEQLQNIFEVLNLPKSSVIPIPSTSYDQWNGNLKLLTTVNQHTESEATNYKLLTIAEIFKNCKTLTCHMKSFSQVLHVISPMYDAKLNLEYCLLAIRRTFLLLPEVESAIWTENGDFLYLENIQSAIRILLTLGSEFDDFTKDFPMSVDAFIKFKAANIALKIYRTLHPQEKAFKFHCSSIRFFREWSLLGTFDVGLSRKLANLYAECISDDSEVFFLMMTFMFP